MDGGERETSAILRRAPLPFDRGEILAARYRVDDVLGIGGMGVVYAATRLDTRQPVAVKVLLPDCLADEELVTRFAREGRAAARIQSRHIARVLDVGTLDHGGPFIVLERLEGSDLGARLAMRGPLAPEDAATWVVEACDAVAEAHSLGIIHRDLKPDNIFLARQPDGSVVAKLLDFGISKLDPTSAAGSLLTGPSVTKSSTVMGSPMYMSPEQLRGCPDLDARSDIWSLGITLYQLLTGECPFVWTTVPELCAAVLKDEPRPLSALRPDIDPELETVVLRCLGRDRESRYESVGALAAALAPHARPHARRIVARIASLLSVDEDTLSRSVPPPVQNPDVTAPIPPVLDPAFVMPPSVRAAPPRYVARTTIATAALLLSGVGALFAWTRAGDATPRAEPTAASAPLAVDSSTTRLVGGVAGALPVLPSSGAQAAPSGAPAEPSSAAAPIAEPKKVAPHRRDVFTDRK